MGEDRSTIANYIRLLDLPDEIKKMVGNGQISMGHARALLGVDDRQMQLRLAVMVCDLNLSVRDLERKVQSLRSPIIKEEIAKPAKSAHVLELENEMTRSLGTKVAINTVGKKGHRGKIIIEFYNLDDFDRIKEVLM